MACSDAWIRGLFRFADVPAGPLDQYAEATLWPLEIQGVLSHATALDLHALCDVNPSRIDITVPRDFRTTRARRRRCCGCIVRTCPRT